MSRYKLAKESRTNAINEMYAKGKGFLTPTDEPQPATPEGDPVADAFQTLLVYDRIKSEDDAQPTTPHAATLLAQLCDYPSNSYVDIFFPAIGETIAFEEGTYEERKQRCELVVQAVNAHAALVEALKGVAIMLNTALASHESEPWAQRVRAALAGK